MPKGDCFEAAGKYILDNWVQKPHLVLVHGEVTGQGPLAGVKFGHGWVEDGNTVVDKSNNRDIELPKAAYYGLGKIKKTVRYKAREAIEKMLDTGNYGPWDLRTRL